MGTSLYNKIHLGRRLSIRHVQLALAFTLVAGATLAWYISH